MRIDGSWAVCDDGVIRPIIRGDVLDADRDWQPVPFLVDVGADRTVLSAAILESLRFAPEPTGKQLSGVGGKVEMVMFDTQIRLARDDVQYTLFKGQYAAFTDPEALDMSVLGRDLLGLFAVIVDRPGDVVTLIRDRHLYRIEVKQS